MRRWLGFLRNTPCALLLAAQLAGVLLYPSMEGSSAGRAAFALFGILVLALTVLAIRATPFLWWVSVLIAIPTLVLLLIQVFTANEGLFAWSSAFEAALYLYAALSMLAYMLKDVYVSMDELFAIGTVFTLLAWSFATLSSTGLSDIIPVTGHARSVVMIEEVAGVFYIAMIVTRLVGLRAARARA